MPRMLTALIAALVLAGCAASARTEQTASVQRPVAVGYVPAFRGLEAIVARTDLSHYSHVNLAFANPANDGSMVAGSAMACMEAGDGTTLSQAALATTVARIKRQGPKVLLSLGGGSIPRCSGDWATLLRPDMRDTVVANLVGLVDASGLDGVDVDIEGALLTKIDEAGDYTPFIAALGKAMRVRGKMLTCATASYEGGMVPVASIPWFDLVNVMSYDAIGPSWGQPGDEHATLGQAERDMALWRSRGVPRDRLVLGVPFYGYGFGSYRRNYAYREIVAEYGEDAASRDVIGERCAGCSYVTHNGLDTLRRKGVLARRAGAGVMVWEVTQDTDDARLIRALAEAGGRR